MSQSFMRSARKGFEFYAELVNGTSVQWGIGNTERVASDLAERRWMRDFPGVRPNRKTIVLRRTIEDEQRAARSFR